LQTLSFVIEISRYDSAPSEPTGRDLVNLNTATVEELRTLPRIGPELASRIVALRRKTRSGFKSLDDLTQVEGIGPDIVRVIEPFVTLTRK
jgi:competence protein ComEA